MRSTVVSLALAALYASSALADNLHFTNIQTPEQIEEVATLILAISEAHGEATGADFFVGGPPEQVELARWLMNELDRPQDDTPSTSAFRVGAEYRLPDGGDSMVRLFYLPFTRTVQEFQQAATAVRSATDIRWLFTFNAPRVVAVRATVDQCLLAEGLFSELSKQTSETSPEYHAPNQKPDEAPDSIQIVHLPHSSSIADFEESTALIRAIGDIRQLFTYRPSRAMIVRGSPEQVALANWLAKRLDRNDSVPREYQMSGGSEDVVRVFYLPQTKTVEEFQKAVASLRTKSGIQALHASKAYKAIVMRGTSEQASLVQGLLTEQTSN